MLLRTRIVLIFGVASLALLAALLVPLLVVQTLTEQALATLQQDEQDAAWSAALERGATPFELLSSQMTADPALLEAAAAEDPATTGRLLAAAQARAGFTRAGVTRIDIVGRQDRIFASSAGLAAESPLIDTSNLAIRLQRDPWLIGLEAGSGGKPILVVTTAFPGGRALSIAANADAILETLGRDADRKLFLVDRAGTQLLSTSDADWPYLSAALARRPPGTTDSHMQLDRDNSHFDVVSTPLLNTAGLQIGTLVSMRDATAAAQRRTLVLLLTGGGALLAFMGLLLALYGFTKAALDPLAEITRVIRAMAAGDSMVSAEMPDRRDEVGAIASAVEIFRRDIVALARTKLTGTLRRAQQQALIRNEMAKLASVLDAHDREDLAADLAEIEASSKEGGQQDTALAEGFRRMAARVTGQHRKLANLLAERTHDLEIVRQALAERAQLSRLRQELEVARHLQLSSLPQVFPPFPHRRDFEIFAAMEPAKEVGGDFYDFALLDGGPLGGDRIAIMIGDASGKGVSAAMFIAMGRSILRSAIVRGASPAQALAVANSTMAVENNTMMFATVFVAILDLRTGWLTYASAGHNPPYLVTPAPGGPGGVSILGGIPGIALGVMEDAEYDDEERLVPAGGSVVLFTDGVTEAHAPDLSMFEETRLEAALATLTQAAPDTAVAAILAAVKTFADGTEQADDITVLSLRFLGPVTTTQAAGVVLAHKATTQETA